MSRSRWTLRLVTITTALLACGAAAATANASTAYVIKQRQANSLSSLTLARSGLRFDFAVPTRIGGGVRGERVTPLLGLIIRYADGRLILLDPAHRTYQVLALKRAISSYESEQRMVEHAQPSAKLPPPPGTKPTTGQPPLTPPPAQLRPLGLSAQIGPVRAQAYLLQQGTVRERLWYSAGLPQPPASIQALLAQALGNSASGPLGRALRAHAAQIPLRIDERAGRRWQKVLRTLSIRRWRSPRGRCSCRAATTPRRCCRCPRSRRRRPTSRARRSGAVCCWSPACSDARRPART